MPLPPIMVSASARASARPSNRSRAMARDKTEAALAPSAWMTRPRMSRGRVSAKAHRMLPAEKLQSPARTSHLRPNRSERAARSWPKAKAMKKLLSVSPSSWAGHRDHLQSGNAGRMMLVASAASAASPASRAGAFPSTGFRRMGLRSSRSGIEAAVAPSTPTGESAVIGPVHRERRGQIISSPHQPPLAGSVATACRR